MFRLIRIAALAAIPLTALSVYAAGQNGNQPAPGARANFFAHLLQQMDTNGDGRISLDEYLAAARVRFQSLDSQNAGSVDAADIASSPAAIARIDHRADRLVHKLDTAGNGYVTQDEFIAAAQKRFARMDRNGDGRLSPDELATHRHARADAKAAAAPGKSSAFAQKRFERLDANHDGVVTQDEYVAAAKALYARLDTQHAGKLTASEIATSPATQKRAVRVANRLVQHMDANGDGSVSQDEFLAAARTRFARIDNNGDGFIEADEAHGRHWAGMAGDRHD